MYLGDRPSGASNDDGFGLHRVPQDRIHPIICGNAVENIAGVHFPYDDDFVIASARDIIPVRRKDKDVDGIRVTAFQREVVHVSGRGCHFRGTGGAASGRNTGLKGQLRRRETCAN